MKILRFPSPKILGLSTVVTLELDLPRYSYFMILENASKNITVVLSNFRKTRTVPYRTVPHRTVPRPYRTKLKLFFKNSLGTFDVSYFRTIIKNLELFLKT
jgi:hypothetical protein